MKKITILAIGKWGKNSPEKMIFDEYTKRCKWKIELKEFTLNKNLAGEKLKEAEAELLHKAINVSSKKILLDERGKNLSTNELAKLLQKYFQEKDEIVFMIGGADGHHESNRKNADSMISLGALTWPHMLVRSMLAEQIYRCWSLLNNHPYHRE